jgi:acetyltransferase-like isoleucine patch superfamily enzyme
VRLNRFLLINEYKYLSNKRVNIDSTSLFDINFLIELDESSSKVSIEKGVFFRDGGRITCFKDGQIIIKEGVFFNRNCSINGLSFIEIGEHCLFGENVKIYDHNHNFKDQKKLIKDQDYKTGTVKIGMNSWIGSNTIILKGVTIGENVVIGANNLIIKDIPSNTIVKSSLGIDVTMRLQKTY